MKVVCLADTHTLHNEVIVPDGDVLIHAGDFMGYGKHTELENFRQWFNKQPHAIKIIVGGNHDWRLREHYRKMFSFALYLENEGVSLPGLKVWGSPETPIIRYDKPWVYSRKGNYVKELWNKIPAGLDILITHGPPKMIMDFTKHSDNAGCERLLAEVIAKRPKVHVFGHIHEGYGVIEQRYGIKFINCSLLDENFKLVNKPIVFIL